MRKMLITGGAGFIGINAAKYFIDQGYFVIIFDNLSRKKIEENLTWLEKECPDKFELIKADVVGDSEKLEKLMEEVDVVLHLAAQVAVTTSVVDPASDMKINIIGTFNVLEALRKSKKKPILLYSSTNKVYGNLDSLDIKEGENRYDLVDADGVSEDVNLDFHSPYGCSKGSADQYVRDYARVYGLKTVVLRQSCIYGENQYGVEDQGWIAWFIIATLTGKDITIFGNGKQVRDILYIQDLLAAYEAVIKNIDKTAGQVYNVGGGKNNSVSLLQFIDILDGLLDEKMKYSYSNWREGDQPLFISDNSKLKKDTDWEPKVSYEEGINNIFTWVKNNIKLFD